MSRRRRYMVDGRLKLEAGDHVTFTSYGRKMIKKESGVDVPSEAVGKVVKIQYDLSEKKFFAIVRMWGQEWWMPISSLVFYSK